MIRTRTEDTEITAISQGFMPVLTSVMLPREYFCNAKPTLLFSKSKTETKERRKVSPKMNKPASDP